MLVRGAPFCEEHALLSVWLPADLCFCFAKKLMKSVGYLQKNAAKHLVNLKGNVSNVQPALCHRSVCRQAVLVNCLYDDNALESIGN